jgi:hypothetical protein
MVKRPAAAGWKGVVGTANSESRETSKRRSEMEDCSQAAADRGVENLENEAARRVTLHRTD